MHFSSPGTILCALQPSISSKHIWIIELLKQWEECNWQQDQFLSFCTLTLVTNGHRASKDSEEWYLWIRNKWDKWLWTCDGICKICKSWWIWCLSCCYNMFINIMAKSKLLTLMRVRYVHNYTQLRYYY